MKKYKRIIVVVADSLGVGQAKDADKFSQAGKKDTGANTFGHIVDNYPDINIPNLRKLGIKDIVTNLNGENVRHDNSFTGRLVESSNGKDTMTGHWEMMGLLTEKPFQTFTDTGFPDALVKELEEKTGYKMLGNYSSSGTEILVQLGEQSMKEKALILYTSADSVLQLCGHEEVIGVKELYKACEIARELTLRPEYLVGRVIARPFIGTDKTNFKRTPNRHDYALSPFDTTAMDLLKKNGFEVSCIGKIYDIFNGSGATRSQKTVSNNDGMDKLIYEVKNEIYEGFCFVNLVEFDSEFGHRRNVEGYKESIEDFDLKLGQLLKVLKDDDLLIITADHGNDPSWIGSDHTREEVPLVMYSKLINDGKYLGEVQSFGSIGMTMLKNFNISKENHMIGEPIEEIF